MATRELESILERLGLNRYLENCRRECIDDACLDTLERDDIRELGLPIGPARRFEAALADRRRSRGSAEVSPVTPSPAAPRRPEPAQPLAATAPPLPAPPAAAPPTAPVPLPAPPRDASGETLWPTGPPGEGTLCEICMDSAVAVRLECSGAHEFCVDCLDRWAQQTALKAQAHTSCPTCRAPVVKAVDLATGAPRPLTKLVTAWGGAGTPAARARQRIEALAMAERREAAERERAAAAALAERERVAAAAREAAEAAERERRRRQAPTVILRREPTPPPQNAEVDAAAFARALAPWVASQGGHVPATDLGQFYNSSAARGLVIPEKGALKLLQPVAAAAGLRISRTTDSAYVIETVSAPSPEPSVSGGTAVAFARALRGWIASQKGGRIEANELADFYKSPAARGRGALAISNLGGPLKLLRPVAAAEGLRIVQRTNGQHAIEVVAPTLAVAPASALRAVEGEILAVVDDRGGQIAFGELAEAYRKVHGKAIDYRALGFERLRLLVEHLPGIDFDPRVTSKPVHAVLRRAVAGDQPTTRDARGTAPQNVGPPAALRAVEREILTIIDGHGLNNGTEIMADKLCGRYREAHGKDIDYRALGFKKFKLLVEQLPSLIWVAKPGAPPYVRRSHAATSAATPAPAPATTPAAPAAPTTRDGVVDALATWIGGLPHPRARSTDVDRWLAWHRARSDVVPEGLDWLTVGQLAPHGLRKRRATEGFFWIEVTASASAPAPAPSEATSAPAPAAPAAPASVAPEPTDPLALFMTRARARVDRAGSLMGNEAPRYTKLPTPRKKLIELCAQQYGLRFQDRADGEHWVLVDGEQWLASQRQAIEVASEAPGPAKPVAAAKPDAGFKLLQEPAAKPPPPLDNAAAQQRRLRTRAIDRVRALVSERGGTLYVSELFRLCRDTHGYGYGHGLDYKKLGFETMAAFVAEIPGLEWEDVGGGVVRLAQAPPPGRFPDQPAPSRETIPLVSEMRDAEGMRALAAFVAGRPDGTLDSGELARFYGSALGQGRRIAKATILAQAEHFDLVVRNKTASGFTLATTLNRTARWALVSEAEEAARPARAPVEAPAPCVEPAPAPAASYPEPAPRAEDELFSYVRADALLDSGSTGARLAALSAAGVLTGAEAEQAARLARVEKLRATGIPPPPPTRLDALRAAGIPPPPPPPQPRESVHLQGFAPARFRSNSPLHDDAAALRERSAADDRAEAGLE